MSVFQKIIVESQNTMKNWWQERAVRERRILAVGIITAFIIIGYMLLEALMTHYRKLNQQLPNLRYEAAQSFFYANQLQKVQKKTQMDLRKTLLQAIASFDDETVLGQPLSEKLTDIDSSTQTQETSAFRINIKPVNAANILNWLDVLETQYALTLHEVSLQANEKKLFGYVVVTQNRF